MFWSVRFGRRKLRGNLLSRAERLAAPPTKFFTGLVGKPAGRTSEAQRRAALGAEAPPFAVLGSATRTLHNAAFAFLALSAQSTNNQLLGANLYHKCHLSGGKISEKKAQRSPSKYFIIS
jgi:hypothetical protein